MITGTLYIKNTFLGGKEREAFEVINPYDGRVIGSQAVALETDLLEAVEASSESFYHWKQISAYERAVFIRKLYQLVLDNEDHLAKVITSEQGKPLSEALGEVRYAASYLSWYAEEGIRITGDVLAPTHTSMRMMVIKEPVGPVAIITPWNFPLAMFVRKMAPALAAGCTVIVKPAEQTPLTAFEFFKLVDQAGFPAGVCQLVTGVPQQIGKILMESPLIRKISFTGSTDVGKLLMAQAAQTVKKVSLELGGHAPFIVFADADLDKAVQGAIDSKFRNCGQVCIATNRVLVEKSIVSEFQSRLVDKVSRLKVGSGFDNSDMGPIIDQAGYNKIADQVDDAINRGAHVLYGGKGTPGGQNSGYLFEPTVLSHVNEQMKIMQEETFGPVLPITTFETEEEALRIANQTPFGLAAYVYTENLSRSYRISEGLEFGMVGINTGRISSAQAPFGGIKESGFGREGGYYGIEEYLYTKYIGTGI